jgi:hypothetical protein
MLHTSGKKSHSLDGDEYAAATFNRAPISCICKQKKNTDECLFYRRVRCMHGRAAPGGVPPVQPQVHVFRVWCPCYCTGNELPHVPAPDPKHVPRRGPIDANCRV